ncbi:MAG: hypothetical protein AB7T06_40120 [Kofleriaceae bacterium]
MTDIEPDWQQPDDIAEVRAGDTVQVIDQGRLVSGIAHHVTSGAWVTAEGGILLRPGLPFRWLEKRSPFDDLYVVVTGVREGIRRVLIRMPDGWYDITEPPKYRRVWAEGDEPYVLDPELTKIIRPGIR